MADINNPLGGLNEAKNGNTQSQSNSKDNQSQTTILFNNKAELAYLKSIDDTVKMLLARSTATSQSNARNSMPSRSDFRNPSGRRTGRYVGDAKTAFTDSFEKAILDGVLGSDFQDRVKGAMNKMADDIGISLQDIPSAVGKRLGQQAISAFKGTDLGQRVTSSVTRYTNAAMNSFTSKFKSAASKLDLGSVKDKDNPINKYVKSESNKSATSVQSEFPGNATLDQILSHVSHIDALIYETKISKKDLDEEQTRNYNKYLKDEFGVENPFEKKESAFKPEPDKNQGPQVSNRAEKLNLDFGDEMLSDIFKDSKWGQKLSSIKDKAMPNISKMADMVSSSKLFGFFKDKGQSILGKVGLNFESAAATTGSSVAGSALGTASKSAGFAQGLASAGGAVGSFGTALAGACPYILAAVAAFKLISVAINIFGKDLKEASKELWDSTKKSANRYQESRKKNLELANKRMREDAEALIKEPFEIIKSAAQKAYDVWDSQLRKINGTQGYSKADLQNLMANYAQRLRDENLSSIIGSTDITENLSKVLDSGLSGKVAEEFAYIATKLNAAIPTQDFFGYAEEYASIAANAIRQGRSQGEAISYANQQLESFASSLLYSNRQLAGGFTTGLKNAQSLFEDAVKISQAAKTNNSTQIASVLTAVSAITGSIAPDLASSMTDAIVKAATGGNSSEIVALRSLAGVNASNTEFLKQLSNDPQKVFSNLFENLSKMQKMSNNAYMEVAEGLSSVFGVSMDAFARIDFAYLADAIKNMNMNNASLDENMRQLISGQTTTTAEQLKLQQINKYMIDEGLSYVLDNEVARSIQEHMWDEQLAREIQENEYSVNLGGAALKFLESIKGTVDNLLNFINPFAWAGKIATLAATASENIAKDADIRQVLEKGKVGKGNAIALKQLTTRNADLNVAPSLLSMMGGYSLYNVLSSGIQGFGSLTHSGYNPIVSLATDTNLINNLTGAIRSGVQTGMTASMHSVNSSYTWGSVSKSTYSTISGGNIPSGNLVGTVTSATTANATKVSAAVAKLNEMLDQDYMTDNFISKKLGYEDWAKAAKANGISDLESTIEEAGYTVQAVQNHFQAAQSAWGAAEQQRRYDAEDEFWANGKEFWKTTIEYEDKTLTYQDNMTTLITTNNAWLDKIFKKSDQFYNSWVDYFVNHTAYNNAYKYSDVERIRSESKAKESGDLVNALAEALVQNTVDLKDPQVQTNALLSQILIVAQAIMNQNNKVGGLSLPDSLNALALGLTKQT